MVWKTTVHYLVQTHAMTHVKDDPLAKRIVFTFWVVVKAVVIVTPIPDLHEPEKKAHEQNTHS